MPEPDALLSPLGDLYLFQEHERYDRKINECIVHSWRLVLYYSYDMPLETVEKIPYHYLKALYRVGSDLFADLNKQIYGDVEQKLSPEAVLLIEECFPYLSPV